MKRIACLLFGSLAACSGGDDATEPGDASTDVSLLPLIEGGGSSEASAAPGKVAEASVPPDAPPDRCADAGVPPSTLECAGLYSDFASRTVDPGAQAYAPAVPLWSDGATKERWIELPAGQKIDASDPNEWTFPIGTKLFKQFTYEGKRVETRMFQKIAANYWVHATYAWNADETATTISYGATVPVDADGGTWVIPTADDCDSCHRGRTDRILGFEQVSLGLEGATGLTLQQLVLQNLISPPPAQVALKIGDDGTGLDGPALSWLHINCGVTCHNSNESAEGYGAKMLLRLDPTLLDGSPATSSWDPLRTTIDVPCVSGSLQGQPRIASGNPSASAIVQLISERGALQMPPIASREVDTADVALVVNWILHRPEVDSGTGEAGADDGGYADGSTMADGGTVPDDEGVSDGGQDAGQPDATLVPEGGGDGAVSDAQTPPVLGD